MPIGAERRSDRACRRARRDSRSLRKSCGSVTASGSFSRKCGDMGFLPGLASTPVAFGRRPVSNDDRLGLHSGYWRVGAVESAPRAPPACRCSVSGPARRTCRGRCSDRRRSETARSAAHAAAAGRQPTILPPRARKCRGSASATPDLHLYSPSPIGSDGDVPRTSPSRRVSRTPLSSLPGYSHHESPAQLRASNRSCTARAILRGRSKGL